MNLARPKKVKLFKDTNDIIIGDILYSKQDNINTKFKIGKDEEYGIVLDIKDNEYYKFSIKRRDGYESKYPTEVFEKWFYVKNE